MADKYSATADGVALVAATAKTVLQIATPASIRARLTGLSVGFDGITAADAPVLVELLRQTSAGTMTSISTVAIDAAAPASLVTGWKNASAEPTGTTVIGTWRLTPTGGLLVIPFYGDEQPVMAISSWLGIRCTAPTSAVNVNAQMTFSA